MPTHTSHQANPQDPPVTRAPTLRADRLATVLSAREEARLTAVRGAIGNCYACGADYIDTGAGDNHCSDLCAAFIAQGGVPKHLQVRVATATSARSVGRRGVYRDCTCCGGPFESLGLKLCPSCYGRRGAKEDFALPGIYGGRASAAGPVVKPTGRAVKKRAVTSRTAPKRRKGPQVAPAQKPKKGPSETLGNPSVFEGVRPRNVTPSLPKTIPCEACGKRIKQTGNRRKTICSGRCRMRLSRARARAS
jgi:hypothetical protein